MRRYKCTEQKFFEGMTYMQVADEYNVIAVSLETQIENYINSMSEQGYKLVNSYCLSLDRNDTRCAETIDCGDFYRVCFIWDEEDVVEQDNC